jgi:hypothetical protein
MHNFKLISSTKIEGCIIRILKDGRIISKDGNILSIINIKNIKSPKKDLTITCPYDIENVVELENGNIIIQSKGYLENIKLSDGNKYQVITKVSFKETYNEKSNLIINNKNLLLIGDSIKIFDVRDFSIIKRKKFNFDCFRALPIKDNRIAILVKFVRNNNLKILKLSDDPKIICEKTILYKDIDNCMCYDENNDLLYIVNDYNYGQSSMNEISVYNMINYSLISIINMNDYTSIGCIYLLSNKNIIISASKRTKHEYYLKYIYQHNLVEYYFDKNNNKLIKKRIANNINSFISSILEIQNGIIISSSNEINIWK